MSVYLKLDAQVRGRAVTAEMDTGVCCLHPGASRLESTCIEEALGNGGMAAENGMVQRGTTTAALASEVLAEEVGLCRPLQASHYRCLITNGCCIE
jgi:hypothetical protein